MQSEVITSKFPELPWTLFSSDFVSMRGQGMQKYSEAVFIYDRYSVNTNFFSFCHIKTCCNDSERVVQKPL